MSASEPTKTLSGFDVSFKSDGFATGLEQSDWNIINCVDLSATLLSQGYDDPCAGTVDAIVSSITDELFGGDTTRGDVDFIVGRPSVDPSNVHIGSVRVFWDLVEDIAPDYVVMEATPDLLSVNNGQVFRQILILAARRDYKSDIGVRVGSDFGVSDNTERFFMVSSTATTPSLPDPYTAEYDGSCPEVFGQVVVDHINYLRTCSDLSIPGQTLADQT